MIQGLSMHEESLREWDLFSLGRGKVRGDLAIILQYLKGGYNEDGDFLFTREMKR